MNFFKQGNNSETSSQEIDQSEKSVNDDNTGMGQSYECNFCKRGFTNAQALGGHMNIHRKDKAKLAKSKQVQGQPLISNKQSQEYMACNYFPSFMSDQIPYYLGFESHMSYQTFVPTQYPSFYNANLSLGAGSPYGEENEEKKRGGRIDIDNGEDVDLELRLGYKR